MKYLFIGGITLIATLLFSKLFLALNLVNFPTYPKHSYEITKQSNKQELIQTGKSLYLVYCSSCHGKDSKGNHGKAQDHTKRIAEKSVLDVILHGSNNFKSLYPSGMPAGLLLKDEAKKVAKFVANGLQGKQPKGWAKCVTCHNENGEGIAYIAPNIKSYSNDFVATVLTNGKKGVIGTMPNFSGRLTKLQMEALASYIRSLNKE